MAGLIVAQFQEFTYEKKLHPSALCSLLIALCSLLFHNQYMHKFNVAGEKLLTEKITKRFLSYVKVCTTSDPHSDQTPSTEGQLQLAKMLLNELQELGLQCELCEHCYVIARIPSNTAREVPVIGFLAHLDTSNDVSGSNVNAIVEKDKNIIRTDGKTLLGADDKAGIAEIISAAEYLLAHNEIEHGTIELIFTPDEETGKGLPCFPMDKITSKACYTLDGGPAGELEIECFNAYSAAVHFTGKAIHPGTARGKLVNASLMAAFYAVMLPRSESPESTDGYFGYWCLMEINGNHENASLNIIVRDFTKEGIQRRVKALEHFASAVEAQFPGGIVTVDAKPSYTNMKEKIDKNPEVLQKLMLAAQNCNVEFTLKPIRGGTDGSRLTELGIPTPNIFTGGRNFHSRDEWVSIDDMLSACKIVIELSALWAMP
ncbi:MAG: tripeptide aminopeptidase PepT [Spirochaetaceae bacterium]|jgi:tripeptide aminopeptidase|nr:tripeptide aminopeptidase PepT [Spirochaetaceae bacterium]